MTPQEKITFSINLPKSYYEDKNKLLGGIIRYAQEIVSQSEVPGELKAFGDETPMSTTEIKETFGFENRSKMSYHFSAFKKFMKDEYKIEVRSLMTIGTGSDIYSRGVVREFLDYMNRNGTKIKITL